MTASQSFDTSADPAQLAADAIRLATVEPERAEALGRSAEQLAVARGDWDVVSAARRAIGVSALQLRRLDTAVSYLHGAVGAAEQCQNALLEGEAYMSLASALVLRGLPEPGFEAIEKALQNLTGLAAARATVQRAAILQEIGHVDEALSDLRSALPILRRADDVQWEVRALSNRSLLFNTRRQFNAAEADLVRARELCASANLVLPGAYVEQNLGCVLADRGDIPAALRHFDEAAQRYRGMHMDVGSLWVDRAKTLLSVRLISEARQAADEAVRVFTDQHREVHLPEAQLVVSTVALLQNDRSAALAAARSASRAFAKLGRSEWLTLARYAVLQIQAAEFGDVGAGVDRRDDARRGDTIVRRLRSAATDLDRSGWTVPSLEARLLAASLAARAGHVAIARGELQLASRARRYGPADVRARAWLAEAMLRQSEGSARAAKSALRAGLRVLEEHRAALGASELRAHVSIHRGELARRGARMALDESDAHAFHWWAEQGRSSAIQARPVRPPADPLLAHLLQDMRATMAEIDAARTAGAASSALVDRQVRLEQQIRDRSWHCPGSPAISYRDAPSIAELAELLGDVAWVEFVDLDGRLIAVTVVDGRATLHRLGDCRQARSALQHLPFALRRLAGRKLDQRQLDAVMAVVHHTSAALHEELIAPLIPTISDRPLVVAPAPWMQSVPWSVVPSCVERPISVAASAGLWTAACERSAPSIDRKPVMIAGPALPAAEQEAEAVADSYPGAVVLKGPAATVDAAEVAMDGASVAHIAAHGTVRSDNPLFSSLLMADGPYTAYDLERLQQTPHHVVLAACNTARSEVTAGVEILGLSAALMQQQTSTIIAPVIPVPDAETVTLMTGYHRRLLQGEAPAQALANAQQENRSESARAFGSAAGFICLGAGHQPLSITLSETLSD